MSASRVFELEEVNRLLPAIDRLLSKLIEKKDACARHHDALFFQELLMAAETAEAAESREALACEIGYLESAIMSLEEDLVEIRALGAVLRNLDRGAVDFLGRWGSKLVFFCWQRGEKTVSYYHPIQDSATARFPLGPVRNARAS